MPLRYDRNKRTTFNSCPIELLRVTQNDHISDYSDSTEITSSTDEEDRWREAKPDVNELPAHYWAIQRLFRYVKVGNETATLVSLCCLRDYDSTKQLNQMAIRDIGGFEILVNLLRSVNDQCCLSALHLLLAISSDIDGRRYLIDLDIVPRLMKLIRQPAVDLKTVAANVIANIAKVRSARKEFRELRAIQNLIDLLDIPLENSGKSLKKQNENEREQMTMATAAANALTTLTLSRHNRQIATRYGLIQVIAKLLVVTQSDVVIATLALCENCFVEFSFKLGISTEKMMPNIVQHLNSNNDQVKARCCFALMACVADRSIQHLLRQCGGLQGLAEVLDYVGSKNDLIELREAVTGVIWKCASLMENVIDLSKLSTMSALTEMMLNEENMKILNNIVGALAQLLQLDGNRKMFGSKALSVLVNFLHMSDCKLLCSSCRALEQYGRNEMGAKEMEKLNAVAMLWSLLRHPNETLQADAARALTSYIGSSANSGIIIRSFAGAFELIIARLQSQSDNVLAAVCGTISKIGNDPNNLTILTDFQVVPLLARLIHTQDNRLRENLAAAIASCALHGENSHWFGELRTVSALVGYLAGTEPNIHRTTTMALEVLSGDDENCLTMHQCGVSPFLLELIGSEDPLTQLSASKCLRNIRNLALKAENRAILAMKKSK